MVADEAGERLRLADQLNRLRYEPAYGGAWLKTARVGQLTPVADGPGLAGTIDVAAGADAIRSFLWDELELLTPEHVLWDVLVSSTWRACEAGRVAALAAGLAGPDHPELAEVFVNRLFDPATVVFATNVPASVAPARLEAPAVIALDELVIALLWRNG